MTEEMPDQDVAAIRRKVGKDVSDTIVEAQPPIADQEHDGHRGERFGERGQPEIRVLRHGSVRLELGQAVAAREHHAAVPDDDNGGARHPGAGV